MKKKKNYFKFKDEDNYDLTDYVTRCYEASCNAEKTQITVTIGSTTLTCTSSGQVFDSAAGGMTGGTLTCPNIPQFCGTVLCPNYCS
jgi:hypothetical protein